MTRCRRCAGTNQVVVRWMGDDAPELAPCPDCKARRCLEREYKEQVRQWCSPNMIGVPSGWERVAAWCWADPPTYEAAVKAIHVDLQVYKDGGFHSHETQEADEWFPDYSEEVHTCGY